MRVLIILALCFAVVAGAPGSRIVGGSLTTIDQYPSIVALLFARIPNLFEQDCGGSIINPRAILSAAHCTQSVAALYRIRVGSTFANSGGTVYQVTQLVNHPQYNQGALWNNDISILRTSVDIVFSNIAHAASFSGANYVVPDNAEVWAAGWGVTETGWLSEQLRHVQMWSINQEVCRQNYANNGAVVNENMMCSGYYGVGGRDQCTADSGGPLYHNGVVVGVCSWGAGCGDPYLPGINVRVSRYINWIQNNA